MKQLGFFIALSLLLHFLVTSSTLYWADKISLEDLQKKPVELEVIDDKSRMQEKLEETRQLVKQLKTSVEQLRDKSKKARFDSELTQRVEKETKAAQLGVSQNANSAPRPKMQLLPSDKPQVAQATKVPKNDGDLPEFARFKSGPSQFQMIFNHRIRQI